MSATKSKVTDMCVFSGQILEWYSTNALPKNNCNTCKHLLYDFNAKCKLYEMNKKTLKPTEIKLKLIQA